LVWYRESKLDATRPVIVVEGQFDCGRIYQQYRNVTALLTASANAKKMEKLLYFPEILWMSDNDKAGQDSRAKARDFYTSKGVSFRDIFVPEDYKDPDLIPANLLKYILKEFVTLDELIV
jgi:DNA primase